MRASSTPKLSEPAVTLPSIEAATTTPEIFNPVPVEAALEEKAREDLASRMGVDFNMISVFSTTRQDWPDTCLGLAPAANQECIKTVVPGWRIVLNAAGHTHEYRATEDASSVSYGGPVVVVGPEQCKISGTSLIFSPEDGYCFTYPVRFHRTDENGPIAIYGPSYGKDPETHHASLTVSIMHLPEGQTLEGAVDTFLAQIGDVPVPGNRQSFALAGESAIRLDVVSSVSSSRDVFIIHNHLLFHFTFLPAPAVAAETSADFEDLYRTVLGSLSFVP